MEDKIKEIILDYLDDVNNNIDLVMEKIMLLIYNNYN